MRQVFDEPWFWWAVAVAVGLPLALIALTELRSALARRGSTLARPVGLIRNYLLPLSALLVLMVKANDVSTEATSVRMVATAFAFFVLILLLSGLSATLFERAPAGSWRQKVPGIFLDVARFIVILVGLTLIFSFIWGANVGGLFAALGIGSIVIGLTLQNSVGQIISGLLVLFEQPFQLGDWVATRWIQDGGRVIQVNWRATHLDSGQGVYVLPNSLLATDWFINLSLPRDDHSIAVTSKFAGTDPPDQVTAMLMRTAMLLPQLRDDVEPEVTMGSDGEYTTVIPLRTPADNTIARSTFLRWVWYSSRRALLHLDGADDPFPPDPVRDDALAVVSRTLRIGRTDAQALLTEARIVRFGSDESMQVPGEVPTQMVFVVKGRVRMSVTAEDGAIAGVRVLERGDYLGQTTLTREPVLASAYALDEVTVVEVDRSHVEALVLRRPRLMQELGRAIEERKASVQRALAGRNRAT